MRTTVAMTVFKMPHYGISFPLSAYSVSFSVSQNTEKLSCANELRASKQASKQASKPLFINKGLLSSDRNLFGRPFHTLFFPMMSYAAVIWEFMFCAAKSKILDYRGIFFRSSFLRWHQSMLIYNRLVQRRNC